MVGRRNAVVWAIVQWKVVRKLVWFVYREYIFNQLKPPLVCRQFAIGEDDHPFSSAMGNGLSKEETLYVAAKTGDLESVRAILSANTNAN